MQLTEMQKKAKELASIVTPKFRASYAHVFKPSSMKGTNNPPKYSVTMLFDKTSDLTKIKEAIKNAKIAKFGSKENWPANIALPLEDGDSPKNAGKEGYKGHWAIKASTTEDRRPEVFDERVQPIINPKDFYSGCYACALVYAFVWEFPKGSGKYGVSFVLDHIQKLGDGQPFGGRKTGEQVFTPVNTGADDVMDDDDSDTESFM